MLNPADLDRTLAQVEAHLTELGRGLGQGDAASLEAASTALQRELLTLDRRLRASAGRSLAPADRTRWLHLQAQGLALREALTRAAATQARALQALQIAAQAEGYGAQGMGLRAGSTGSLVA